MAGNSIGNAIVTVLPQLEKSGLSKMESDLDKSGKSGGSKLSGGISSAFKKLAALGIGVEVGKALGDTFIQSFQQAARYEQLADGVKTLFGDSKDTLIQYAKEAYKTAGLSANQYMDQATSFSASLLQSLGGDTKAAADYANMAMIDMSDNANKMGTNMESITNAYQGFAKGNFTMLDNLKLGYGGTKQEMERLLERAEEIKAENGEMADYSVDSFSDIVEAIHVVQDEMGIMGTTSEEASGTVEGSIGQMQAAWENLLTAMGTGENVEETAQQMVDAFIVALGNIIPLAGQVMVGLITAIVSALGNLISQGVIALAGGTLQFIQTVGEWGNGMLNTISGFFGDFESAARNLIDGMVNGLAAGRDAVVEKIRSICSGAVDAIKSFFGIASPSKVMRRLFGYVGDGMALGLSDSEQDMDRAMDSLLDSAYGRAADFGIGLNAQVNGRGRATNADVVGAINRLERNLSGIIESATPDGLTERQFGRLVRAYA